MAFAATGGDGEPAGVPGPLRELVRRCLAEDPAQRPSPAELAARNRPASATDGCWPTPAGPKVEDLHACYAGPFPYSADLRTVAGAPIPSDVTCPTQPGDLAEAASRSLAWR